MKPAFALDFRDNAISLLHRTGSGWHQVGSVALDELISLGPDSVATNTLDLAAREALGGAIHLVFLAALVVAVLAFAVTALAPRGRIAQRGQEVSASAGD